MNEFNGLKITDVPDEILAKVMADAAAELLRRGWNVECAGNKVPQKSMVSFAALDKRIVLGGLA